MRVVTSPISNLAIIDGLEFLRRRYGSVCIPPVAARELSALSHVEAASRVSAARSEGWLTIDDRPLPEISLPYPLDDGENDAIALAVAIKADMLLIDENRGREAARQNRLAVGGILGELLHAKEVGWIESLRNEIDGCAQKRVS